MRRKIVRNAVRCNHCGDVIESKYRHDFKTCSCGRVSVDGGLDYLRRCYSAPEDLTGLSVTQMEGPAEMLVFNSSLSEEEIAANFSNNDFLAGIAVSMKDGLTALKIESKDKEQETEKMTNEAESQAELHQ